MAVVWLAASSLSGCLPPDDRPEPGSLSVSAVSSEATRSGFETSDGWTVSFDKVMTSIGDIHLQNDHVGHPKDQTCNSYSDTHYDWFVDLTRIEREKIGIAYGLNLCSVEFRFRSPNDDTVMGNGGNQADFDAMRVRAADPYSPDGRVVVLVIGRASKGEIEKRFEWNFRRSYELKECPNAAETAEVTLLTFEGGDEHELTIEARMEELFRIAPDDEEPLHFDRFAEADEDDDGNITLLEMAAVDALEPTVIDDDEPPPMPDPDAEPPKLVDVVYTQLLPRILRIEGGGACLAELRKGRWR